MYITKGNPVAASVVCCHLIAYKTSGVKCILIINGILFYAECVTITTYVDTECYNGYTEKNRTVNNRK